MSGQPFQTQEAQSIAMQAPSTPFLLRFLLVFFPSASGHDFGRLPELGPLRQPPYRQWCEAAIAGAARPPPS
jgi:hypothetical protein